MLFKINKLFIGTIRYFAAKIYNEEKYDDYKESIYRFIVEWAHATVFGLFVPPQIIYHRTWRGEPISYELCCSAREG